MKKILYLDMDDTLADFCGHFKDSPVDTSKMYNEGFFRDLKPVAGALAGVRKLAALGYELHILTQPVAESAYCYMEKMQWIGMWFPELISKLHMVQDKGLMRGHYLIDDNAVKWRKKFESGGGHFIHFEYTKNNDAKNRVAWDSIITIMELESKRNE